MLERLGKYELLERIGVGGMAEVYRSRSHGAAGTVRPCVIKRMLPFPDEDRAAMVDLFVSEAKLSMQLTHGNVVQVFDFGEHEGQYFLVMELVEGITLRDALDARGAIPPQLAALILIEALRGLHYAHTRSDERGRPLNIVHRDVSPDNILLGRDGQVKLTDFGIARASMVGRAKTDPGIFRGKMAYSSPEQLRADELDLRTDVYACALTLWTALTGANPQEELVLALAAGTTKLPDPARQMDARLAGIVRRATAPDPIDRTANAQELRVQLSAWLDEQGMPFRETAVAGLVQAVSEPDRADRDLVAWLGTARQLPATPTPMATPAVRTAVVAKAVAKGPRRSAGGTLAVLALLVATVVGGLVLMQGDEDPGAIAPLELPAGPPTPPPPPTPRKVAAPAPVEPVPAAPELVRSTEGVPAHLTLSSKDFGLDVTRVGIAVREESAKVRLVSKQQIAYFVAPPAPGAVQLLGHLAPATAMAPNTRLFVLQVPGRRVDLSNPDLTISWVESGKTKTRTIPKSRGEANVFVDERRFVVGGLDPAVGYQVVVSGPTGGQVFVLGEASIPAQWARLGDPVLSGFGPQGERVISSGSTLHVKAVRGLVFMVPTWPDQPEYEMTVTVQRDSRVAIDRGNFEAQQMDAERRRLERRRDDQ